MMRTFDFVNVVEISLCRGSSHIQPKTFVKDFCFPLPEAAEFDSGRNGIVRTD
jgi:hypothetical protein